MISFTEDSEGKSGPPFRDRGNKVAGNHLANKQIEMLIVDEHCEAAQIT